MIGQKSGSIVNISSMAGKQGWSSAQYSASKSGVIGQTRSVAMGSVPHGGRETKCPGRVLLRS